MKDKQLAHQKSHWIQMSHNKENKREKKHTIT